METQEKKGKLSRNEPECRVSYFCTAGGPRKGPPALPQNISIRLKKQQKEFDVKGPFLSSMTPKCKHISQKATNKREESDNTEL